MANILLLDDNDLAARAMAGILTRGHHRLVVAGKGEEAWTRLRELGRIDLVFVEPRLQGEDGLGFIQRMRSDVFLKPVPVVVYTKVEDHALSHRAYGMQVQNYLVKPYSDEVIHHEIAKALACPWLILHFEEEKSFCAQMRLTRDALHRMLRELMTALDAAAAQATEWADGKERVEPLARIEALSSQAQAAGFWGAVEYLQGLQAKAEAGKWDAFKQAKENLELASRLIFLRLNPDYLPEGLLSDRERAEKEEAKERARWTEADVKQNGPMLDAEKVLQQVDGLPSWPVIDSMAAAFAMTADGKASSLTPLMDLVGRDPALTAQVLVAANHLERDDLTVVTDPRVAVNLLGNLRLGALGRAIPPVEERYMQLPPITWPNYWMFQSAVARLADFTCQYLEFQNQIPLASTAGLLHDIGRLLFLKLYPFGFQAMVAHAKAEGISLHQAEQRYLGINSREAGYHFACKQGLPAVYCNVIRWAEHPEKATEDLDLVAAVSLARDLALHNHVGYCGDTPKDSCPPIEETSAWQVLQNRVFPSFNLARFEAQARARCAQLKQELLGRTK